MRNGGPRQPGGGRQTAGPRASRASAARIGSSASRRDARSRARRAIIQGAARASVCSGSIIGSRNKRPPQGERAPPAPSPRILQPRRRGSRRCLIYPRRCRPSPSRPTKPTCASTAFWRRDFRASRSAHIQRIVRKGELRVNGKRVDPKDRLQAGQAVRIPPLSSIRPSRAARRRRPTRRRALSSNRSRSTKTPT